MGLLPPPTIITKATALPKAIARYRKAGKSIVLTQGVFDLVHIGHARYCEAAKSFGDVLLVGIDSDQKVKARKGPDRPVVPEAERLEMVAHLRSVDAVILKHLDDPKWWLIKTVKPDVLIATKHWYSQAQLEELKKYCQKVVILDPMATTSTSAKLRLVQLGTAKQMSKTLSQKILAAIESTLAEMVGEESHDTQKK